MSNGFIRATERSLSGATTPVRVDLIGMAMKGYTIIPKAWSTDILSSYSGLVVGSEVLLQGRDAVSVF